MQTKSEIAALASISVGAFAIYELISKTSSFRRWLDDYLHPFVRIGTVSQLFIHPIKSSKGHLVDEATCTEIGLMNRELRDRYFVIVNAETKMGLTARQLPKMVLIETAIEKNKLTLSGQNSNPIVVRLEDVARNASVMRIKCQQTMTEGLDCGEEVGVWLKQFLVSSEPLRLLYFSPGLHSERQIIVDKDWQFSKVPNRKDEVVYPDLTPYMAVSQASLDDLNLKFVSQQFEMRNFRPNIVVAGCPAYDEDLWSDVRIGDQAAFVCVKPCTRCIFTTINPNTGEKSQDTEPLKTLRKYRLAPDELRATYKDSPIFGVHMGLNEAGVIKVGDPVYVRYKKAPY
uniref:MOSC domain-containing protein n=1 Tax=Plectus sambesii TaxID=2011161 RepID=A0A914XNV7_9BILA